jgi:hypothetical protein
MNDWGIQLIKKNQIIRGDQTNSKQMKVIDFIQFLFRMTVSKSQLLRDIETLRHEVQPLKEKLVPFSRDEMEILSLQQSNVSKKGTFSKVYKGIFDTIYFENLIAYAIRTYSNQQKLILITTSSDEFVYLTKGSNTHVFMNNKEAGLITKDGKFYTLKNKLLGSIEGDDHLATHTATINGRKVGYIANPRIKTNTVPRAFSLLNTMNDEECSIFLCLTLINLVEEAQMGKI